MYKNSIRYIIMVVVILALVIGPTTWFDKMIKDDVNGFREKIGGIMETGDDISEREKRCDELQKDWDDHMKHWSFFIHHTVIEKVDLSICTFIEHIRDGNYEDAEIESKKLDKIFTMTEDQDKFTAMNIL